ncbi:unnamed protein product, partial [Meganyctiphanes norvegica]
MNERHGRIYIGTFKNCRRPAKDRRTHVYLERRNLSSFLAKQHIHHLQLQTKNHVHNNKFSNQMLLKLKFSSISVEYMKANCKFVLQSKKCHMDKANSAKLSNQIQIHEILHAYIWGSCHSSQRHLHTQRQLNSHIGLSPLHNSYLEQDNYRIINNPQLDSHLLMIYSPPKKTSHLDSRISKRYLDGLRFSKSEYRSTVPESIRPHSSIIKVVAKPSTGSSNNGLIKYSVSDSDNFGIDNDGILYNTAPLDAQHKGGEYRLYVQALDQGSSSKVVRVPVRVRVTNDPQSPIFDSTQYFFSVSEFSQKDDYVGTVVARDPDKDFGTGYSLENVEPEGLFTIDATSGIISVGDGNRDEWSYSFLAVAEDNGGHISTVPVTVNIIDENTNKPQFNDCASYDLVKVQENVTNVHVVKVQATDADTGINGEVTYSLLNDYEVFAIDAVTGQITITQAVDRDEGPREYFLTVIGKDSGAEPQQGACSFSVIVEDINDNNPAFDQEFYSQNIPYTKEMNAPILRVTATDLDSGQNAHISYSFEAYDAYDQAYFAMDNNTGVLRLIQELDSDMTDVKVFHLTARATDEGTPTLESTVDVTVSIVSSGELPPSVVSLTPDDPQVSEDAGVDTEIATICARSNALEPDVDMYIIPGNTKESNGDGTFSIKPGGQCGDGGEGRMGIIYVSTNNLDYETVTQYKLIVQIVNLQNSREDYQVQVDVLDVNDNPPLLQAPFSASVGENSDQQTLVTTIRATDKDVSEEFGRITYRMGKFATDDVKNKFRLNGESGELWTMQSLDREEIKQYRIPIVASDGVHNKTVNYWVSVTDVNDEKPSFNLDKGVYEVLLPETTEVDRDTDIVLKVDDKDIVNEFSYQIISGNEDEKFRIDPNTGDVLINKKLDYDNPVNDRNFTMAVRVGDGIFYADTDITIAVQNMNDQRPEFEEMVYEFEATENEDCDIIIGQVTAMDPDKPPDEDQDIRYWFSVEEMKNFTIDALTGEISVKGCLDRENATRGTMTLYPRANDQGGDNGLDANPATVLLTIIDKNDNHPYIQSPENGRTRIMENSDPMQVPRVPVQLSDLDSDEFGCPCTLELDESAEAIIVDSFEIEQAQDTSETSSLYYLKPLKMFDREEYKYYRIPFKTTDRDGLSGVRTLYVDIGDENDSPMTDGESFINVYNVQGQFPDLVIGSVYVTDADDDDLDDKTFNIDATTVSEVENHFSVDANTGNITMKRGTREGIFELRVKVEDGYRKETATGSVTIKVIDLPVEAVRQSGSLQIAGYTAHQMLDDNMGIDKSLHDKLKEQIAMVFDIKEDQVDIFTMVDIELNGENAVEVRYNCHSSPYYTAPRLNGLILHHRKEIENDLAITIPKVDINECLYEETSPCGEQSCQHFLINLAVPLVIKGETLTIVGVKPDVEYECQCDSEEPMPEACPENYCHNGGTCQRENETLFCMCPDEENYGPRCELKTARFNKGFAWYTAFEVCENPSLNVAFTTKTGNGVILYNGPTVLRPWENYPGDFLYVLLDKWELKLFLELGSGTVSLVIPIESQPDLTYNFYISWDQNNLIFDVPNCGYNSTSEDPEPCSRETNLSASNDVAKYLLNVQGPLQVGGIKSIVKLDELAEIYNWSIIPPMPNDEFQGCIQTIMYNDHLYDMSSTDYYEKDSFFETCNATNGPDPYIYLGSESIVIIVFSLLALLLLVLIIVCLSRRGKRPSSHPDLNEVVKETIGATDLEGFGEKDIDQYDLSILRIPPGTKMNGTLRPREPVPNGPAPIAEIPEDETAIGEFIESNIKKVNEDIPEFDDTMRHYCYEGDVMSIASLSSIGSGSSDEDQQFDYLNDWGPRFEKLANIYGRKPDDEEDSEYEFPHIPKKKTISKELKTSSISNPKNQSQRSPSKTKETKSMKPLIPAPKVTFITPTNSTVNPLAEIDNLEECEY